MWKYIWKTLIYGPPLTEKEIKSLYLNDRRNVERFWKLRTQDLILERLLQLILFVLVFIATLNSLK